MKIHMISKKKFMISVIVFALIISEGGMLTYQYYKIKYNNELHTKVKTIVQSLPEQPIYTYKIEKDIKPQRPHYNINLSEEYQDLIWKLCQKNNLSYEMVLSLFHLESEGFDVNKISFNKNGTKDGGIAQINSRYANWYKELAIQYCDLDPTINFNPLNPDNGIRAGIGGLTFWRDYWRQRGISEEDLFNYLTNSYNEGALAFERYVKRTGTITRGYDRAILKRKENLERYGTLN